MSPSSSSVRRRGLTSLNPSQWFVLATAAVLQTLDGFSLAAISFAASQIAHQWQLTPVQLGTVLSAAQLGAIAGAGSVGWLARRFGRKPMLLFALTVVGAGTLATGLIDNLALLLVVRILAGVGLGILSPTVIGYGTEFMPSHVRGLTSSIVVSAFPVGTIIGGVVAAFLIPQFGWHVIFVIGGAAPLAMVPLAMRLPPSLIDLRLSGATPERLAALERRFAIDLNDPAMRAAAPMPHSSFRYFFRDRLLATAFVTIMLGTFFASCVAHFLNNWLPAVLEEDGATIAVAAFSNSIIHAGGMAGNLWFGALMDRHRPYWVNGIAFGIGGVLLAILGILPPQAAIILTFSAVAGFFVYGGAYVVNAFSSVVFANEARVAALGYVTMVGRIAGVVAPFAAGIIMSAGGGRAQLFSICAALLIAGAAVMATGGRLAGRETNRNRI